MEPFAEQAIWWCFYLFTVAGGIGIVNWTMAGAVLLVVLFLGSSAFAEEISAAKYPDYADYCRKVSNFYPDGGTCQRSNGSNWESAEE